MERPNLKGQVRADEPPAGITRTMIMCSIGKTDEELWFGRADKKDGTVLLIPRGTGVSGTSVLRVRIEDISGKGGETL